MKKIIVNEEACICCGACMQVAPELFSYGDQGQSVPKKEFVEDDDKDAICAAEGCPTSAISLVESEEKKCNCENCNCDPCRCGETCDCNK